MILSNDFLPQFIIVPKDVSLGDGGGMCYMKARSVQVFLKVTML
jgi:hypothetical protein